MTRFVIRAGDGYGCHFESVRGVTLCGRAFDVGAEDISREQYKPPADPEHPHATLCFDCHSERNRQRGEMA